MTDISRSDLETAVNQLFGGNTGDDLRKLIVQASYAAGTAAWCIRAHRDIDASWQVQTRISIKTAEGIEPMTTTWDQFARFFELREWNGCIVQLRSDIADRIAALAKRIAPDRKEFEEYQRLRAKFGK